VPSSESSRRSAGAEPYFLDANVVMYAAGSPHPLRDPCRAALQRAVQARTRLVTDVEVLQELLHRYFALRRPEVARTVYESTVNLCDEVLSISEEHTARALELLLEQPRLSPRDALHVAVMERRGIRRLLSTDHDFDGLAQIDRVDPSVFQP
jgi:predicted nucleic acid-binding protein